MWIVAGATGGILAASDASVRVFGRRQDGPGAAPNPGGGAHHRAQEDVLRGYDLFISKPVTFSGPVDAMRVPGRCWIYIVELPPSGGEGSRE